MKTRKRKIWSVILVVVVILAAAGYAFCDGSIKPEEQAGQTGIGINPTEDKNEDLPLLKERQFVTDLQKLASEEYEKWMEAAGYSANGGYILYVKAKLTMARWCVEDANIPEEVRTIMLKDFSEKAEAITLKVYSEAASGQLVDALCRAYGCREASMRSSLERFKFYSLKAGMEPDGKVKKVREILAASLAERKELEN